METTKNQPLTGIDFVEELRIHNIKVYVWLSLILWTSFIYSLIKTGFAFYKSYRIYINSQNYDSGSYSKIETDFTSAIEKAIKSLIITTCFGFYALLVSTSVENRKKIDYFFGLSIIKKVGLYSSVLVVSVLSTGLIIVLGILLTSKLKQSTN